MSENPKLQRTFINTNQPRPGVSIGPGGPGRAGMKLVEKPKNFKATMKKLILYTRPLWISIIFVFIFAIASTIFAIVSPKILGNMTNQVVSGYAARAIDFGKLRGFAIELLFLYILSAIFSYIQGWIMTGVSQKITYQFRRDISLKINRLPLAYFDKRTFGEVRSEEHT